MHFSQILYDEMWEEAVSDLGGKYFEMSTVCKLLLCRQLVFDFEMTFHDEGEQMCLSTIFGRIERILCYIVSDVRNEEFANVSADDVVRAFLSKDGKWYGGGGHYGRFESALLSGIITVRF